MFWLTIKKIFYLITTLIWRPGTAVSKELLSGLAVAYVTVAYNELYDSEDQIRVALLHELDLGLH